MATTTSTRRAAAAPLGLVALLLFAPQLIIASDVVKITGDNFEQVTDKKTLFVKFFSPLCEHCKTLAPAWEDLGKEYKDHPVGLVGEVDCNAEPRLCKEFDVVGLPTLLFGDPYARGANLQQYNDAKDINSLTRFAKKTLVPLCSPGNPDACDDETRQNIERYLSMSFGQLEALVNGKEAIIDVAEDKERKAFDELQKMYNELLSEKEIAVAKIREDVKLKRAVLKLSKE